VRVSTPVMTVVREPEAEAPEEMPEIRQLPYPIPPIPVPDSAAPAPMPVTGPGLEPYEGAGASAGDESASGSQAPSPLRAWGHQARKTKLVLSIATVAVLTGVLMTVLPSGSSSGSGSGAHTTVPEAGTAALTPADPSLTIRGAGPAVSAPAHAPKQPTAVKHPARPKSAVNAPAHQPAAPQALPKPQPSPTPRVHRPAPTPKPKPTPTCLFLWWCK
jgi:hypothetical protein